MTPALMAASAAIVSIAGRDLNRAMHTCPRRDQLAPAFGMAGQIARRLGQQPAQRDDRDQRHQATGDEKASPSDEWQRRDRREPSEGRAKRHAHDGGGDGQRSLPHRHVLGGERGGVRDRAAEAETGQESQSRQRRHVVHCGDRERMEDRRIHIRQGAVD